MKQVLFAVAVLLFCAGMKAADAVPDPEELAVYSVLFNGKQIVAVRQPNPKDTISPWRGTISEKEYVDYLKKDIPDAQSATAVDYYKRVQTPALLTPDSQVGVKLVFVDRKSTDEIFTGRTAPNENQAARWKRREAEWAEFQKRFSTNELITISRVGFNADKTQALVYLHFSNDAEGFTYFLEKVDDKWVIKKRVLENAE